MDYLEAVNIVLRAAGKPGINDLDVVNDDGEYAKRVISEVRTQVLSNGYGFNSRVMDLSVTAEGRVEIPLGYLDIRGLPDGVYPQYDEEADPGHTKLFLYDTTNDEWYATALTEIIVVLDRFKDDDEFRLIPEKFAYWIARRAAANYWEEINQGPSQSLESKAVRAKTLAMQSREFKTIHGVTGFSALRSVTGGSTGTYDDRTQSHVF